MPLMGSFYVGQSGLQTSSNALNTSAHNLANVQTTGYTRQQVLQGSRVYNTIGNAGVSSMQIGLGVDYTKCRQVRDVFLDASYRRETGRAAFYGIGAESADEIETLLGEMEGASFKEALSRLWTSVQELEKDPASAVTQGLLVSTCSQFIERASAVAQGLNDYQDNLNTRVKGMVDDINDTIDQIFALNNQINKTEIGIEQANDFRDQRNYLVDKLSTMVNTKVVETAGGDYEVYCEGNPVIIGAFVNHMAAVNDEQGFYKVTWGPLYDNMNVFDFSQEISSALNTDIGELRALLLARGDHRANYSDLEDAGIYNNGDPAKDNPVAVAKSVVMDAQAQFDRLIHNIVTSINNIVCDNAENKSGTSSIEVFSRIGSERYDTNGDYIREDTTNSPNDTSTMYTISNIRINPDLLRQPTLNTFIKADKSVDYEKAGKIAEVFAGTGQVRNLNVALGQPGDWVDAAAAISPNANSKLGFTAFYDSYVGNIANIGYVYNSITNSQNATADSLENARQQVLGVSSEEELQNIIKFQNAYNASSRYINVVNEMLAHIIERL